MIDNYNRSINYMRVSITPYCNLRCSYCMPNGSEFEEGVDLLSMDEIIRMCRIGSQIGIDTIKITGGEPLVRKDFLEIVREIKKIPGIQHVTLTSNGVLLEQYIEELKDIGITSINVSLDSLHPDRFMKITGKDSFQQVWNGIMKSISYGIATKINCVPQKGVNDDELWQLASLVETYPMDVRFIEMMPIGYGNIGDGVLSAQLLEQIKEMCPDIAPIQEKRGFGPAHYYSSSKWIGKVGFIDAVSHKFCNSCNRIRLTSSGFLKTCLCYEHGFDFLPLLRKTKSANDSIEFDELIRVELMNALHHKPYGHNFAKGKTGSDTDLCDGSGCDKKDKRKMFQIGG